MPVSQTWSEHFLDPKTAFGMRPWIFVAFSAPVAASSAVFVVNGWQDILNRADLGMEVMHERNAHNFPLDLA